MASVGKCIIGAVAAATVAAGLGTAAVGSAAAAPTVGLTSPGAVALSTVAANKPTSTALHGADVMKKAAAALAASPGVRMVGNTADDDNPFVSQFHGDVVLMPGDQTSATLTQGDNTFYILGVGGVAYFKAPGGFYVKEADATPAEGVVLDGRWLKYSAADSKDLLDGLTLSSLAASLKDPKQTPVIDAVTQEIREGRSLLVVTDKTDGAKFYIDPATYLPVEEVLTPGANGSADIDFLDYGISVPVAAPSDALDSSPATVAVTPKALSA